MQEHFTISFKNSYNYPNLSKIVVSLLLSILIIYPIMGLSSVISYASIIILYILFYIILDSMSNSNLQNELPSTIYPSMPHLGLDGISLNNYNSGMKL